MTGIVERTAEELDLRADRVRAVVELLDEGATVPFIARYRKEASGGLDEVKIIGIRDLVERFRELEKRRESILKTLARLEVSDEALGKKILAARDMETLEDLYLPYRPKRKTRASIAREKGLEPLAEAVLAGRKDIEKFAVSFVSEDKGVESAEAALAGARDIVAETVSEDAEVRNSLRRVFREKAVLRTRVAAGKEEEGKTYRDYFEFSEPAARMPSHRFLAARRGVREGVLRWEAVPEGGAGLEAVKEAFLRGREPDRELLLAIEDSYERLLEPSLENELLGELGKGAEAEAIRVFMENLRDILLEPPLGRKMVVALDPGFRTGCKVACLDAQGGLLRHATIYPLEPHNRTEEAAETLRSLADLYGVEAFAVGNGTGGREAENFLRGIAAERGIPVVAVNESGASVYSASETARKEFPDHDVTVRGAVSIGRRLQDPLAEIVKIDPKAIGVGQYQHDVDQKDLKRSLDDVVSSCVNAVGADLNTASPELLCNVSGLSERLARAIVEHRKANGAFRDRKSLLDVAGMGRKTFEQCAGFLRVSDGEEILDSSAVHPERYDLVRRIAKDLRCTVEDLVKSAEARKRIVLDRYVEGDVGLPTLEDILRELEKPGRDPRNNFEPFSFTEGVNAIEHLFAGMEMPGVVTNVTNFGAFVDIGVHQDGLVHISELADVYVKDPRDVVKVRQRVRVRVIGVDVERKRISLSMRKEAGRN